MELRYNLSEFVRERKIQKLESDEIYMPQIQRYRPRVIDAISKHLKPGEKSSNWFFQEGAYKFLTRVHDALDNDKYHLIIARLERLPEESEFKTQIILAEDSKEDTSIKFGDLRYVPEFKHLGNLDLVFDDLGKVSDKNVTFKTLLNQVADYNDSLRTSH